METTGNSVLLLIIIILLGCSARQLHTAAQKTPAFAAGFTTKMVLEEACRALKADPHTAEGLLPLFEERTKSRTVDKEDQETLKSACGAAIVSRLLLYILVPDEKNARQHGETGGNISEGETENDTSGNLMDLATSLAHFLEQHCKTSCSITAALSNPLTALDVVRYCTRLLSKSGIVTKLVFGEHSGGSGDEEIQKKLDLVVNMLHGIEHEIKLEMSLYVEFEEIWSWAREELLPAQDPREMLGRRECAWLLQCLLSMTDCSQEYHDDIYLLRRSLVCAAVCMLFETMTSEGDLETPSSPHRKRRSSSEVPDSKRQKTTADAEQEAIAVLSMMPNSAATSPPSNTNSDLGSTSSHAENMKQQFCERMNIDYDVCQSSTNLILKFIEDQEGITRRNLGTPKVLNILRCMYRDLRLDYVSTDTMGVVNDVELYHSAPVRRSLIGLSDVPFKTPEQKSSMSKLQGIQKDLSLKENCAHESNKATVPVLQHAVEASTANDAFSWLSRLYIDASLARPSHTLTQNFDHSGGVALWQSITSILDRALQRLSDYIGEVICFSSGQSRQQHLHSVSGSSDLRVANTASVNIVRHQIQTAVLALYYYSLEKMLSLETQRLGTQAHPQLLSNSTFHRSLLAVGSECVLRAASLSNGTDLQFPAMLDITEIDACDFIKISECFVRALCSRCTSPQVLGLPMELKKHLHECEELVLDKLLWESSDSNSATCSNGGIRAAIEALQHHTEYNELAWPPLCLVNERQVNDGRRKECNRILLETMSRALQQQHMAVSFVFRKLATLSARRILDLSELLSLDQFVTEQIWLTWKQCLAEHVSLLYDRHMDQLIICTIYGVCKIARVEPEVSFARIFECYYDLNPGKERISEHIIRHIPLGADDRQGNVIHLYNQVFVPMAKQQLWKFKYYAGEQRARAGIANIDDAAKLAESLGSNGRRMPEQLSGSSALMASAFEAKCNFLPLSGMVHTVSPSRIEKTNIYVSPFSDPNSGKSVVLYNPTPQEQFTPRPRALYAFGESSSYVSVFLNTYSFGARTRLFCM